MSKNVIALLCSDIHLSHNAPVARSAEPNWYSAMKRPLDEIADLAKAHDAPIICAGDVFDRWNSPPELINFAIDYLPNCMAIPGQHDLPNHRLDEIHKSAFNTLVKAHKIYHLQKWEFFQSDKLSISAFAWGEEILPHDQDRQPENDRIQLAVIHHYLYTNRSNSYHGVSIQDHTSKFRDKLKGYDAAVFGDNHIGFSATIGKCNVMNTGTLLRRKIDEINYKPQVGLLHEDGSITPHFLDTSEDKFIDIEEAREKEQLEIDADEFLKELKGLGSDSLDFRHAVNTHMGREEVNPEVRTLVTESLE